MTEPEQAVRGPTAAPVASVLRHGVAGLLERLGGFFLHAVLEQLVALVEEVLRPADVLPLRLALLDLGQHLLLELDRGLGERRGDDQQTGEPGEGDSAAHAYLLGHGEALTRTPTRRAWGVVSCARSSPRGR